jgi:hypothetical protein
VRRCSLSVEQSAQLPRILVLVEQPLQLRHQLLADRFAATREWHGDPRLERVREQPEERAEDVVTDRTSSSISAPPTGWPDANGSLSTVGGWVDVSWRMMRNHDAES